jgi:hypothetical protein
MSNHLYDLRDQTSKQQTHPLADNNVVVVDPDTGDVFDPRQGYTANQLPARDMMVVPRTTWYVKEVVQEWQPGGRIVTKVIDVPPIEQQYLWQPRKNSSQLPPSEPPRDAQQRRVVFCACAHTTKDGK